MLGEKKKQKKKIHDDALRCDGEREKAKFLVRDSVDISLCFGNGLSTLALIQHGD